MKKQHIVIASIVALLLIGVGAVTINVTQNNSTTNATAKVETTKAHLNNKQELAYSGKTGSTALALLQEYSTAETTGTGEMAYVTSIDGLAANPSNQYWAFLVNGEMASVGAGSFITKDTDIITWKLSSF